MRAKRIWLDVGDLFWWPHRHVSGIQRVMASVILALAQPAAGRVRLQFCAYSEAAGFAVVPRARAELRAAELLDLPLPRRAAQRLKPRRPRRRPLVRAAAFLVRRLPLELQQPTRDFCYSGEGLAKAIGTWAGRALRRLWSRLRPAGRPRRGDLLLNIGSSWINPPYNDFVRDEKARCGLTYALLLYDCNPYSVPHFHSPESVKGFLDWASESIRLADVTFTISHYSQRDLVRYMRETGLPVKVPHVIRLGDSLLPGSERPTQRPDILRLAAEGDYWLTVAGLAPSKNHKAIVGALRDLADRGLAVPRCVWVGNDVESRALRALLADNPDLAAHIEILGTVDDNDLKHLYRHCRATLFPSYFEGWGLPVGESLAFGKPCLAAGTTSIPEVGGALCDYFDPDDPAALADLMERYLDDAVLAARSEQIRRGYRPTSWAETCRQLLAPLLEGRAQPAEATALVAATERG